jgi:hypothetical protein
MNRPHAKCPANPGDNKSYTKSGNGKNEKKAQICMKKEKATAV